MAYFSIPWYFTSIEWENTRNDFTSTTAHIGDQCPLFSQKMEPLTFPSFHELCHVNFCQFFQLSLNCEISFPSKIDIRLVWCVRLSISMLHYSFWYRWWNYISQHAFSPCNLSFCVKSTYLFINPSVECKITWNNLSSCSTLVRYGSPLFCIKMKTMDLSKFFTTRVLWVLLKSC